MRFNKIAWNGETLRLEWQKKDEGYVLDEVLTSTEIPSPSFTKALAAFVPLLADLLEVPSAWRDCMIVTQLSVNREKGDGRIGCIVTARKPLKQSAAPFLFNSPHLRQAVAEEEYGRSGFLNDDWMQAIERLDGQASLYMKGQREQLDAWEQEPVRPTQEAGEEISAAADPRPVDDPPRTGGKRWERKLPKAPAPKGGGKGKRK